MTNATKIASIIWIIYIIYFLGKAFNVFIWCDIKKNKRKFFWIKATCFLWEADGAWEFDKPDTFKEPYRTYLQNHPYEFELLVEEFETSINSAKTYFFVSVDHLARWDDSFANKSRKLFATFHIDKDLVSVKVPVQFSWRYGLQKPKV